MDDLIYIEISTKTTSPCSVHVCLATALVHEYNAALGGSPKYNDEPRKMFLFLLARFLTLLFLTSWVLKRCHTTVIINS